MSKVSARSARPIACWPGATRHRLSCHGRGERPSSESHADLMLAEQSQSLAAMNGIVGVIDVEHIEV
jgi:hypothetical protein